jgi:hypothetical protein
MFSVDDGENGSSANGGFELVTNEKINGSKRAAENDTLPHSSKKKKNKAKKDDTLGDVDSDTERGSNEINEVSRGFVNDSNAVCKYFCFRESFIYKLAR